MACEADVAGEAGRRPPAPQPVYTSIELFGRYAVIRCRSPASIASMNSSVVRNR
jgi:hypothetical protein